MLRRHACVLALALWVAGAGCSGDDSGDGAGDGGAPGADMGADGDAAVDQGDGDEGASTAAEDVPARLSGDFLALTYNVAGLPELLSSSMPERFTPMISPLLNDYDLVLVQESWLTPDPNPGEPQRVYHELLVEQAEHPYQSVPAEVPWGMDERRPSALLGDGLNRLSRFPFEEVTRVPWGLCVESAADCLALKGFSMARTTLEEGVTVDVYNLHMEAGGTPEDDAARSAGIEQMIEFIDAMSAGRAVIVGGDFNLHTDREPAATQFQHLLDSTGMLDACSELGCEQPGSIDKFLYRGTDAIVIEATRWSDESAVFQSDMGEDLSDHPPIAVGFRWETR